MEAAPSALAAAVTKSDVSDDDTTLGRTRDDVAWQLEHLVRYEREAIQPRLQEWLDADEVRFHDWEDVSEPEPRHSDAELQELLKAFRAERERTMALLSEAGPDILDRTARIDDEEFTAYQLLRATAQHDDAHIARIGERLHRSLLEESE